MIQGLKTISWSSINAKASERPADYIATIKSMAVEDTAEYVKLRVSDWRALKVKYRGVVGRVTHGMLGAVMAASGVKKADPEIIEARKAICAECPENKPCIGLAKFRCCGKLLDVLNPTKKTCGCRIDLKTQSKREKCPLDKWASVE